MVAPQPLPSTEPKVATTARPAEAGLALMLLADGRFPAGGHAYSAGAESACADGRIVDEATLASFVSGRLHTTGLTDAALGAATVLLVAACRSDDERRQALAALDAEADARIAAPSLRAASRKLGRQLVRVAGRCWPDRTLGLVASAAPGGVHQAVALGAVGVAAGLSAEVVARLSLHHAVTTPAQAAVRLLGLDPFGVAAIAARLAPVAERIAGEAAAAARAAVGHLDAERADAPPASDPSESDRGGPDPGKSHLGESAPSTPHPGGPDLFQIAQVGLADLPALGGPLVEIAAVEHRTWDVRMFAT